MKKVTGEVPAGFQLTKKSEPASSISTSPPELTVKPHEMLQCEIINKVSVRVMSFGIPFPGIEVVLRQHPELFSLRRDYKKNTTTSTINACVQILEHMFACISDPLTARQYFADSDDGSLWFKLGPLVTDLLRRRGNNEEFYGSTPDFHRALLLSEPTHMLASLGYDVSKPDGGISDDMLEPCRCSSDVGSAEAVQTKLCNFSKFYKKAGDPDDMEYEPADVEYKRLPLTTRVILEFYGPSKLWVKDDASPTSFIGQNTILETDDMFERRLEKEYADFIRTRRPYRPRPGFSQLWPARSASDQCDMERSQIYKDARNQRNSEVHMAILDTKYKLINDVCAFVMGELSVDSLLSTTAKLIEKPVTVPTGIGFSAFIQALKAVTALQARARAHAVQLQYRELIGAIRLYAAARSRRDAAISCFRFADLRDPPSASVPQVSPAAFFRLSSPPSAPSPAPPVSSAHDAASFIGGWDNAAPSLTAADLAASVPLQTTSQSLSVCGATSTSTVGLAVAASSRFGSRSASRSQRPAVLRSKPVSPPTSAAPCHEPTAASSPPHELSPAGGDVRTTPASLSPTLTSDAEFGVALDAVWPADIPALIDADLVGMIPATAAVYATGGLPVSRPAVPAVPPSGTAATAREYNSKAVRDDDEGEHKTAHEYSKQGGDDNDHPDDDSVPSFLKKAQEYFDAPAQLDDDYSDYPSFLKKARGYFNAPTQLDDDDPSDLDSRSASPDAKKPELELTDDNAHYDDEHDDKEDEHATDASLVGKYDPLGTFNGKHYHQASGSFLDTVSGRFEYFEGEKFEPHRFESPTASRGRFDEPSSRPGSSHGSLNAVDNSAVSETDFTGSDADDGGDGPAG